MPERLAYRSSGRSILAELALNGETFVVGSFHATPGAGTVGGMSVGEWKPFFHGAVALELAHIEAPFVFGIDANEPRSETLEGVAFHWEDGRSGVEKMKALLGLEPIHRGRDLLREWLRTSGREPASRGAAGSDLCAEGDLPAPLRLDLGDPGLHPHDFATHFDQAIAAGGDHALLVADLQLLVSPTEIRLATGFAQPILRLAVDPLQLLAAVRVRL